jgi:hypothetical protein
MPKRDRTGPLGEGPMTGRQAGPCAGNDVSIDARPGRGFDRRPFAGRRPGGRRGAGRRGRRGRNRFYATGLPRWNRFDDAVPEDTEPANEAESLEARAAWLRGELDAIDQRLQELDQGK